MSNSFTIRPHKSNRGVTAVNSNREAPYEYTESKRYSSPKSRDQN